MFVVLRMLEERVFLPLFGVTQAVERDVLVVRTSRFNTNSHEWHPWILWGFFVVKLVVFHDMLLEMVSSMEGRFATVPLAIGTRMLRLGIVLCLQVSSKDIGPGKPATTGASKGTVSLRCPMKIEVGLRLLNRSTFDAHMAGFGYDSCMLRY